MRKSSAYCWMIGVTLAAVTSLLCWCAANRSPLETALTVTLAQTCTGSIRQTLDLAGAVSYADQRYAMATQSGIAAWVTAKGEGELVGSNEALVRLDTTLTSQLLAQALAAPASQLSLPDSAAAVLNQLNPTVSQLEETLDQSTVRAYTPGQVLQTLVRPGEWVQAGSPVALLASTTPQVIVPLTTGQRQQLCIGTPALICQNNQKIAEGSISVLASAAIDEPTGSSSAQMTITLNHPPALRMGEAVEVRVILQEAENIVTVPLAALDEQGHVWQVIDGRAWQFPAEAQLWDSRQAWIPGVPADAWVILNPTGLKDGQRVKEAGS